VPFIYTCIIFCNSLLFLQFQTLMIFSCLLLQSMIVFFNPVKFGVTFTLGNLMALGRSVLLAAKDLFNLYNYISSPFVRIYFFLL